MNALSVGLGEDPKFLRRTRGERREEGKERGREGQKEGGMREEYRNP